ncbi:hypothetical protein EJ04DRAFT_512347 [Polyplosphaeria fusca]|uniref:Uncharacterized protein n=1 Tax=Polyplosphaeria fusca TaxID=682080 RepID=A0A9P4V2Y6_9PLEO|nr:hypothetical protein EJ04DRAFT_512347 [Polyplosphaeria fusca]
MSPLTVPDTIRPRLPTVACLHEFRDPTLVIIIRKCVNNLRRCVLAKASTIVASQAEPKPPQSAPVRSEGTGALS